jgi:predicted Fe-Mo cluster-binding NifX family protein
MHYFPGKHHPIDQVDILITGGCGEGFKRRMDMRGIKVIVTSETDIARAAEAAANGRPVASIPHSDEQRVSI